MELLLKTYELVKYITEHYNNDFRYAGYNYSPLFYTKSKEVKGYFLYFKSRNICFDFIIKPEVKKIYDNFAEYICGTYFLKLLSDKYDFEYYYRCFLRVVLEAFKKQSDYVDVLGECEDTSPYIFQKLKEFKQANLPA